MKQPLFKYTGSKRHIAKDIISSFPKEINTYYEPFLGGGSIFLELLKTNHNVKKFVLSDINETMIKLFNIVKSNPEELISSYAELWNKFQNNVPFYYEVREEYNKTKNPLLFHFLTRTCYNGTIRFNKKGGFNVGCHFSRPGVDPVTLEKVMMYYHELMKGRDITFINQCFTNVEPVNGDDIVYCDPPYTNNDDLYVESFNKNKFENWLRTLNVNYYFNLNCINVNDNEEDMSSKLFNRKILLKSGNSSFSRLKNKQVDVKEYFYIKENNN